MLEKICNRLISVKSIVTIILTVVFSVLTIIGRLDQNFIMIYTVIISFYFGSQVQKSADNAETKENIEKDILAELQKEIKHDGG